MHTPILAKAALTGPAGDNTAGTLLHGGSAATTDSNGLAWVASEWCGIFYTSLEQKMNRIYSFKILVCHNAAGEF